MHRPVAKLYFTVKLNDFTVSIYVATRRKKRGFVSTSDRQMTSLLYAGESALDTVS